MKKAILSYLDHFSIRGKFFLFLIVTGTYFPIISIYSSKVELYRSLFKFNFCNVTPFSAHFSLSTTLCNFRESKSLGQNWPSQRNWVKVYVILEKWTARLVGKLKYVYLAIVENCNFGIYRFRWKIEHVLKKDRVQEILEIKWRKRSWRGGDGWGMVKWKDIRVKSQVGCLYSWFLEILSV